LRKKRNSNIDFLRGIAILMVLLQHTMSICTKGAENSFLFNVIWSLQMPLFFLISGYVTKYSREICNRKELVAYIERKTVAYLLPWIIWTFGVRGIVFGGENFLNVGYIVYHMDSGYWFLFSLWTISLIWGVVQYLSTKVCGGTKTKVTHILPAVMFTLGAVLLLFVGYWTGRSFLGLELTIYYMPFYLAGHLWGKIQSVFEIHEKNVEAVIAMSCVLYVFLLVRFDFYAISDTTVGIFIRAVASLLGCIAVCGLLSYKAKDYSKSKVLAAKVGVHSLEIYLVQYFVLAPIRLQEVPQFETPVGIGLTAVNYILTVVLSIIIAYLLNQNIYLKKVLFGKR